MGAVDATVHANLGKRFNVQGYPTIKFFPAGSKTAASAEDYTGGRTSGDIVNWAMDKFAENAPAPEVHELTEQKVLDDSCENKQICLIAVMPNILDCQSSCRNAYLSSMRKMADKYKRQQWGWLWTEAGKQPEIENALGIGGFGYPAMAAVNMRKGKYITMRGSFSENGLNEFLRDTSYGRGSSASLPADSKLPKVVKSDAWDGKDGELPIEEDIDLSDVVLDDLEDAAKKDEL